MTNFSSHFSPISVDVLIIGAGMAGLSTAYYLSRVSNLKTVVLEAYQIGHDRGSSFGEERMYRRMYSNKYLSDLQEISLQEWRHIEETSHCQLLRENGLLFYGEVWQEETIEGSLLGAKKVMEAKNIPFEEVDAQAMSQRWPMTPHTDFIGLYEMTAGTVWAQKALNIFYQESQKNGVIFYQNEKVSNVIINYENSLWFETSEGRLFAPKKIVLAVGIWTNLLLAYFQETLPYTFQRKPDPKLAHLLDQFLRKNWRGIGECVSLHCCPYTMTPDTLFILDRLPQFPQISLFTGGSGQAFKFAPIIGKLLSQLVLEQSLSVDTRPLSWQRFKPT